MGTEPTRLTKAQSRQQLLDVATELLLREGFGSSIDVKLKTVVAIANRTTGSAYNIWADQADFQRDLAAHLLTTTRWAGPDVVAGAVIELALDGQPMQELIRVGCHAYLEHLCSSREFAVLLHFWAVSCHDLPIRALIRKGYESFHRGFRDLYAYVVDLSGLQMANPFTIDDLTTTITALVEGFALRNLADPARVRRNVMFSYDDRSRRQWDLFSAAAEAIVIAYTEPKRT